VREPRHFYTGVLQKLGDVVRGGLAVDRGVERKNDFLHLLLVPRAMTVLEPGIRKVHVAAESGGFAL
jgi:hypothetical protein